MIAVFSFVVACDTILLWGGVGGDEVKTVWPVTPNFSVFELPGLLPRGKCHLPSAYVR